MQKKSKEQLGTIKTSMHLAGQPEVKVQRSQNAWCLDPWEELAENGCFVVGL